MLQKDNTTEELKVFKSALSIANEGTPIPKLSLA